MHLIKRLVMSALTSTVWLSILAQAGLLPIPALREIRGNPDYSSSRFSSLDGFYDANHHLRLSFWIGLGIFLLCTAGIFMVFWSGEISESPLRVNNLRRLHYESINNSEDTLVSSPSLAYQRSTLPVPRGLWTNNQLDLEGDMEEVELISPTVLSPNAINGLGVY